MSPVTPEKTAKRLVNITFIFLVLLTIGVVGRLIMSFRNNSDFAMAISKWFREVTVDNGTIIMWVLTLLLWIYFRNRYKMKYK